MKSIVFLLLVAFAHLTFARNDSQLAQCEKNVTRIDEIRDLIENSDRESKTILTRLDQMADQAHDELDEMKNILNSKTNFDKAFNTKSNPTEEDPVVDSHSAKIATLAVQAEELFYQFNNPKSSRRKK